MSKSPNNDYATESNGGAFMTEVAVQEQEPVSRVEDETFQFYEDPAMQKLPTQTRWPIVSEDVAESMGMPEGKMLRQWRRYFNSEPCAAIVRDVFWYCFCTFYKNIKRDNFTKENVKKLKNRVAANYAKLLYEVTVNNGHRDLFLPGLTNAIAQAVFLIFYHSYPRSRAKLTDTFKINVIDTCSGWLSGTRPSNPYYQHWQNSLREKRGGASMLKNNSVGVGASPSTGMQFTRRKKETADSMPIRRKAKLKQRTVALEHTPLMHRFLTHKHGPNFNTMTKVNIRMTEDPERPTLCSKKPKATKTKPGAENLDGTQEQTFKDVVRETRKRMKSLMSQHTTALTLVLNETAADRRELYRAEKELESKYQAIKDNDIHEYSNFLVSKAAVAEMKH
eukprot:g1499.t1